MQTAIRKMSKVLMSLIALACGATSCSQRQAFPWSLEGKTVPAFTIHSKEDFSVTGSINYTLSVILPAKSSREELTLVSQKIIQDLPKHSLVIIFYFADEKEVTGEFTVGKAWWGVDDSEHLPPPGDYSHHVLRIELKPKGA